MNSSPCHSFSPTALACICCYNQNHLFAFFIAERGWGPWAPHSLPPSFSCCSPSPPSPPLLPPLIWSLSFPCSERQRWWKAVLVGTLWHSWSGTVYFLPWPGARYVKDTHTGIHTVSLTLSLTPSLSRSPLVLLGPITIRQCLQLAHRLHIEARH